MKETICVVGLGYIGLPTAVMFARADHTVICVDTNLRLLAQLEQGQIPFDEPLLQTYFEKVNHNRLSYLPTPSTSDVFIIAVPTPVREEYKADLTYVESAINSILPVLEVGNLIIIESTIPPKTTDGVVTNLLTQAGWRVGEDIFLAHCPERVLPGKIIVEMRENARIIGGINEASCNKAASLYRSFVTGTILTTSSINAEMCKLMENTYRDVNIALANELAKASSVLGVNPLEVIQLANHHPRVQILQPGPGVGGHCIAVDPYFIIQQAHGQTPLMQTAREINTSMPAFVAEQVTRIVSPSMNKKISIFGITYKGNVSDFRESPALEVIHILKELYTINVHDPKVEAHHSPVPLVSLEDCLVGSELLIVLADHDEFYYLDAGELLAHMKSPIIFDTKNCVKLSNHPSIQYISYNNLNEIPDTA
ncbi:nucleotide sugar dehydrogenase [Paenibacillus hexagrammi]|uniref:Nucleotide sugar dehydrogenase n=1 Tax=Paenibacillus hexagrammi TaxID=2908839 RepID=A0ABY3SR57_9BACL|nr:nucleotide sugar dehydrogenase [Paenibacillus sp. YPD9-1]UJF36479.1 nucleotide sugar dehydrogenase [Paenibacillus sp. YPD9-1]